MAKAIRYVVAHIPTLLYAPQARQLCSEDVSELKAEFPQPTWTFARKQPDGSTLPQIIGHRGYKAAFPENTMAAFRGAVEAGVHCIETDVHVTRDGVVVLSHDGNLRRCFGRDANLIDLDWAEVQQLRTTEAPHEPMPRLVDLLAWLAEPGREDIWVLLDIKVDVDPTIIMSLLGSTLAAAPPHAGRSWHERVVLGVWGTRYLPLVQRHLSRYAVTHITFSTLYARRSFLPHPYVCFNALAAPLALWPWGERFVAAAHRKRRSVTVWTVNDPRLMRRCVALGVDGICTDDPARLRRVLDDWRAGPREAPVDGAMRARAVWFNFLSLFFLLLLFQWRVRDALDGGRGRVRSWKYRQLSGRSDAMAPRMT